MNPKFFAFLQGAVLLAASFCFSQTSSIAQPVLDVSAMDRTVDPCVDFYAYACGGWLKNNPIPADQSSWGVYSKLTDENLAQLRGILEEAAKAGAPPHGGGLIRPFDVLIEGLHSVSSRGKRI